jgi:hypothetical protein
MRSKYQIRRTYLKCRLDKDAQNDDFKVYQIDEYKTQSICTDCEEVFDQKFKTIQNPRTYQRHEIRTMALEGKNHNTQMALI